MWHLPWRGQSWRSNEEASLRSHVSSKMPSQLVSNWFQRQPTCPTCRFDCRQGVRRGYGQFSSSPAVHAQASTRRTAPNPSNPRSSNARSNQSATSALRRQGTAPQAKKRQPQRSSASVAVSTISDRGRGEEREVHDQGSERLPGQAPERLSQDQDHILGQKQDNVQDDGCQVEDQSASATRTPMNQEEQQSRVHCEVMAETIQVMKDNVQDHGHDCCQVEGQSTSATSSLMNEEEPQSRLHCEVTVETIQVANPNIQN
eukprot:gnl/MRDRNA2_/MRDRNA2_19472_c0_seq1.p1 gnl/MRDRNA2_/MRDRNA2_19472_c0~~gnl/MRDRNA2_/MRDRNA2_19472_c0_seq1.p1  ORF type:complete len:259 (+),score=37.88 gnl/MRDRNA2_/MRDRNA2_19472_c0_seq1:116-892(+)